MSTLTHDEPAAGLRTPTVPKLISVDDHVIEPPNVWLDRLPAKYHDVGPRVERRHIDGLGYTGGKYQMRYVDEGIACDCWRYEDLVIPHKRIVAAAGLPREEITMTVITYDDMPPGCYDQTARLQAMDENWTEASLCFPTFPRFCGQTFLEAKDRELAMLCVRAYNDWMVEEWCGGAASGRLIPLTLIPLWDAHAAAAEVRRNADRGVHAVCFSEIPPHLGLPSVHDPDGFWDPFFDACAETSTVVNMHIGSSSVMPATSADAPAAVQASLTFNNAMGSMSDFIFSGVLARFPDLRVAYSEGQIGWIPYLLERMDNVWLEHRGWGGVADKVPEPPSTYYFRQIYGCFFDDAFGLESLRRVGEDNVTFEVDYPHSDSTWPNSRKVAERIMAGLPDEVVHKLVRGNAIRMLSLDLD
jgi:predicted TIM-barrel fold metal-dependent hydrolase